MGGASPSVNHSSDGKMDPLFYKGPFVCFVHGEPEAEGFSIKSDAALNFFFLSGLRVYERIKCSGGQLCQPPTFCFGCKTLHPGCPRKM